MAPLHRELVVRIVPTRFLWCDMGIVLLYLRLYDRVRSSTLSNEEGVREFAFNLLAVVGNLALIGDGAIRCG